MRVPRAEAAFSGPTTRAINLAHPALMLALALALTLWRADTLGTPATAVWTVRAAALVLIAGALPAFDDPAAPQVAAVPLPLAWRVAPRITFALAFVALPLIVLTEIAQLPVGALALEAATLLSLAAGACLLLARAGVVEPSLPVGVGLLLAPAALLLLPERAALLVPPGPLWGPAHSRWVVLLGVGLLLLVRAMRDPAQTDPWRPDRRRRPAQRKAGLSAADPRCLNRGREAPTWSESP